MIRMEIVIFSGMSKQYFGNDFRIFLEIIHCLTSRNSYGISVRKQILKVAFKIKFCVD